DRSSEKESYVIRVRERQEADEENVNLSAEQVQKRNIKGITLLERLILELKYWDETSNHLDVSNLTLCTGSRYSDGHVPYVDWRGSCLYVSWCNPQDAYSCWRARTVVSF
ncbi:hypothetical protein KKA24_00370, partial [Patescibacteria group bacterium]|nr:hypothetical protein [Patescibacteria group bacterium]